jgi:PAS domain S-box-containing protein
VIADPRAVIIPDIAADPDYVQYDNIPVMRSMILVPLSVAGQLIGMLTADKPTPNSFTNTDLVVLSTLADQAAVAIENARLFEAERDQRALAETLHDLSTGLSRTLNVSDVLDRMLTEVGRVVSHDAANIMMIEEPGAQAQVVRSRGYDRIEPGLSAAVMTLRFPVRDTVSLRQAAETGRPLVINDTREFPGWIDTPQTAWVRSQICGPLRVRDQVVGFFNLDSATPGFFTNAHAERLMAFATQAAVAIENARLYEETRRRFMDQSLLYEAGQAISSSLEFNQVLETISQQLVRATNAQIILIQLWDRAADEVRTIYQKIQSPEGLDNLELLQKPFAPTDYLKVAQYLRDRRNISLRLNDDDLDPLLRARMREVGLLWIVEVPIVSRDEVLGLVRLGDTRFDRTLSDSEVQLIETLINQAAVAMSNARLYDQIVKFTQELEGRVEERTRALARANEDLKMERDQVETLFRIASELSTSLDLDRVLNRALELVVVAAGATHGSILLIDPQTDVLVARAILGGDRIPSMGRPTPFRRGEGLAGWAIVNRQSAIIPDVHTDERWVEHDERIRKYRSALVVPLSVTDDVLGAMLLLHPEPDYFNDYHMRMVSAASSQVATAINNAELYRYIREQAELLGGMLRAQQVEGSKSQAILESVADGVMVSDGSGRVILFNAAAERILTIKRDDAIGRQIDDMLGLYSAAGGKWVQQVREWHASAEARRRTPILSQRIEFQAEKRYVTVNVAPVTMSDEYLGSVSVFRDITAEVEADRAKTEFISTVSHELRTPMTSIKGYADLLLIGAAGTVNENQQRFLSVIKSNADRLSILVNDLLDISRIESGRVKLELKPIGVEGLLETVVTALRGKFEEKHLTVHVSLPEGELPFVQADRDRVIQILTNLVGNAYQYTAPGGMVTVSAHEAGEFVQFDVADTGIGISPENQSKVFERFYRVDDPNVNEFPGTGLGLAIVRSLVEMHEGRIWLQSEVGRGTTFSFTLHAVRETLPATATPQPLAVLPDVEELAERASAPSANGDSRHVLVVEDDKDIAELIGRHLVSHGYQVSIAGRAQEALEKARAHQPNLITLDIYLPDADGFELLQQLKNDPITRDIPVVIVSVMSDQHEGLRLGAVDYLTKPIDPLRLVSSVNRVLQGPGKVLVVDDDRDTRDLLQTALEQRGFSVVLTSSGKRALTLARQEHPNLILLDLKLPGMDGYEVLQRLKSLPETAEIPVMVITGSLTDDELKHQKLLSLGAARFMTKPFAVDELVYEIGVLVTNRTLVEPVSQG